MPFTILIVLTKIGKVKDNLFLRRIFYLERFIA